MKKYVNKGNLEISILKNLLKSAIKNLDNYIGNSLKKKINCELFSKILEGIALNDKYEKKIIINTDISEVQKIFIIRQKIDKKLITKILFVKQTIIRSFI